jgi:hypothetical protein
MPFELPSQFQKTIAVTTQKVYKSKLNKLAEEGYGNVNALSTKRREVIQTIKNLTGEGDDEKERLLRRYYLCAIFWVLPGARDKTNAYYQYWQKCIPLKVNGTENDWVKRKNLPAILE